MNHAMVVRVLAICMSGSSLSGTAWVRGLGTTQLETAVSCLLAVGLGSYSVPVCPALVFNRWPDLQASR